jgi:hypothetical protein
MAEKRIYELDSATLDGTFSIPVDVSTIDQAQQVLVTELRQYLTSVATDYATGATYDWPLAADYSGLQFTLKCQYDGVCAVSMQGSETMDGGTTFELIEFESITALSDGTNWLII